MKVLRETARRTLQRALDRLPPNAILDLEEGTPPDPGLAARVRIEWGPALTPEGATPATEVTELRTDEPAGTPIQGTDNDGTDDEDGTDG